MTEKTPEPSTGTPEPPDVTSEAASLIEQWEFVGEAPTRDRVTELLSRLPSVWGVKTVDFADYVQALPQRKKIKVPREPGSTVMIDQYLDCWTLYMSVAGRMKMLEAAAEQNGWMVDFEPEPVTPTGCPGMLQMDERVVYREYVRIEAWTTDEDGTPRIRKLGRKSGTAWVPSRGGSGAVSSNPYEKVETSARGRAIAAWGFGVLPGSGVA